VRPPTEDRLDDVSRQQREAQDRLTQLLLIFSPSAISVTEV
jgi:hypothetical protein